MTPARRQVLLLDNNPDVHPEFLECLRQTVKLTVCTYSELHHHLNGVSLLLVDVKTALMLHEHELENVFRGPFKKAGLVTAVELEEYIGMARRWGVTHSWVKQAPVMKEELNHFLECLDDAGNGFGLYRYLTSTMEMYSQSIATIPQKNQAIEKVINHFATAGFEIHGLFDVRLVLEEALNNALYHAFVLPSGQEKYSVSTFTKLAPTERIRVEYGNCGGKCGLTVTDNAGSLSPSTVLRKLERQYNREAALEVGGRGLYLSRVLSTLFCINIEENKRTQIVALFDERRSLQRPRSLVLNYIGDEEFSLWRPDSDMD